jgi:hypothetical protein
MFGITTRRCSYALKAKLPGVDVSPSLAQRGSSVLIHEQVNLVDILEKDVELRTELGRMVNRDCKGIRFFD